MGTEICKAIEESKFYNRYGAKSGYTSGCSTYVAPITNWIPNKQICIQVDSLANHSGMTNAFKKLYNKLAKKFDIGCWMYNKNDGSCPQEYIIWYN